MRTKTQEQIEMIRQVQKATEAAMAAVIEYVKTADEPTSENAHKIIDQVLEAHDCESPEGNIVASGEQGVEPHDIGSGIIQKGTVVVIDIYPRSKTNAYFADMTRTVCVGEAPPALKDMYRVVLEAQTLGISLLRPGASCGEIHAAVAKVFTDAGYVTSGKGKEFPFAEGFVHGVGHGVGLEIHEAPSISRNSTDILQEGDVVTVEPGLYYKGVGGIRLEDMLLITPNGAENLTDFPKVFEI